MLAIGLHLRSGAVGAGNGTVVSNGASLELQSVIGIDVGAETLSLNGTGNLGTGALRSLSGANIYRGAITLAGATLIQAAACYLH